MGSNPPSAPIGPVFTLDDPSVPPLFRPRPLRPEHWISNWTHFFNYVDRFATLNELRQHPRFEIHHLGNSDPFPYDASSIEELDCSIHPLWRYAAWRTCYARRSGGLVPQVEYDDPRYNISAELYERIKPALRMATIMLHRVAPLLVRIAFFECTDHDGFQDIDPTVQPTFDQYEDLDRLLDEIAREVRLFTKPDCYSEMGACAATFWPSLSDHIIHVTVSPRYFEGVDADEWWNRSDDQKRAMLFFLATTLVHELAHCVFMKRKIRQFGRLPLSERWAGFISAEPRMPPETYKELGKSVEVFHYGFIPRPRQLLSYRINHTTGYIEKHRDNLMDGTGGLMVYIMGIDGVGYRNRRFLFNLDSLKLCFDRRMWQREQVPYWLDSYVDAVEQGRQHTGFVGAWVDDEDVFDNEDAHVVL